MTSPAQLKYLDALGIPVWVSRDSIIESSENIQSSENIETIHIPDHSSGIKTPSSAQEQRTASQTTSAETNNSALSLLSSLDDPNSTSSNQSEQISNSSKTNPNNSVNDNPALAGAVTNSVDKATLADESLKNNANQNDSAKNSINLLFKSAHHYIYATGSEVADWMVIGHSPEPFSGIGQEPFAAESGELLNNMIKAVGVEQPRSQAYFMNVIDVNKSLVSNVEIQQQLKDKMLSVIEKIKPKVILLVGQNAAQNLLGLKDPLIIMRSKVYHITESKIPCVVTYYPSYLLHKTTDKRKAWNDLKLAMSQLK